MKLVNHSSNALMHNTFKESQLVKTYFLEVGKSLEVPDEIAKIWLNIKGIEKCVEQEDIDKAVQEALEKERAAVKAKAKGKTKAKAKAAK